MPTVYDPKRALYKQVTILRDTYPLPFYSDNLFIFRITEYHPLQIKDKEYNLYLIRRKSPSNPEKTLLSFTIKDATTNNIITENLETDQIDKYFRSLFFSETEEPISLKNLHI